MMGLGGGGGTDTDDDEDEEETTSSGQATITESITDETENDEESSGGSGGSSAGGATGSSSGSGGGGGGGVIGGSGGGDSGSDDGEEESNDESESEDDDAEEQQTGDKEREQRQETETEDDSEEDEDEEPQEAELTIYTDAWDATGWGIEPTFKQLKVDFGPGVDISYELLAPRTLNEEELRNAANRYEMPYASSITLPETTELSTKALRVAKNQDQELFRDYLRRLRIAALVEGRNIEDREFLLKLAGDVGFNTEQFGANWEETGNKEFEEYDTTPVMWASIGDVEVPWSGHLEYELASGVFLDQNVPPLGVISTVTGFVSHFEPTPTAEIAEFLGMAHEQAAVELEQKESLEKVEIVERTFWTTR